jgi:hypothetical protein
MNGEPINPWKEQKSEDQICLIKTGNQLIAILRYQLGLFESTNTYL